MIRGLAILPILLLPFWAPGCVYDLDVEGKQCETPGHPCPAGYHCAPVDGGNICKVGSPTDGGNGNDGDRPGCFGDETDCDDIDTLLRCELGSWKTVPCGDGKYCSDFGRQEQAACHDECTSHEDCQSHGDGDFYCDSESHCQARGTCVEDTQKPDENRCNPDGSAVVSCNSITGWDEPVADCNMDTQYCDRTKAQCRNFCEDDSGCSGWDEESCNPATGRCEPVFLCDIRDDCHSATAPSWIQTRCEGNVCECTGGVCVTRPTEQCTTANLLDLSCYLSSPGSPGTTPTTCNLEGRVVQFIFPTPVPYNADIEVRAHAKADILGGIASNPLKTAAVTDDGSGKSQYSLQGLQTNTELVLEVRCKDATECGYHTMYTFGIYLRADECTTGTIDFAAPAIPDSLWPLYSTAGQHTITADSKKGIFLGRIRECSVETNKIEKGTGDVSMSREVVYYIRSNPPYSLDDDSTLDTGFFGAVNVLPVRGLASALVRDQGSLLSLRTYEIRIFENSASLVFFEEPKKPW